MNIFSLSRSAGVEAIVQFSSFFYDRICIRFDEVPIFWTLDNEELCNFVVEAATEAEAIESPVTGDVPQQQEGQPENNVLDI